MINYFGRQEHVDRVEVSPVLLRKGNTRIALYGLGNMRDERLNRLWQQKKVRFLRPAPVHEHIYSDGKICLNILRPAPCPWPRICASSAACSSRCFAYASIFTAVRDRKSVV